MPFLLPSPTPITSWKSAFPYSTGYGPTTSPWDGNLSNWNFTIGLRSSPGAEVQAQATCTGHVSAVPPSEINLPGFLQFRTPTDNLDGTDLKYDTVTLYLEPDPVFAAKAQDLLKPTTLGARLLFISYENISVVSILNSSLGGAIRSTPSKYSDSDQDKLELFCAGNFRIFIWAGQVLGAAALQSANLPEPELRIGVCTDIGFVDPIEFYKSTSSPSESTTVFISKALPLILRELPTPPPEHEISAFSDLFPNRWWPSLDPAWSNRLLVRNQLTGPLARIYPSPVLYEVKSRLGLNSMEWREIGDLQVQLFWQQLRARLGLTPGITFIFCNKDIYNPFQLEAVANFFLRVSEPAKIPVADPGNDPRTPTYVDFLEEKWTLVMIDPFDDLNLGVPPLPNPDYYLSRFDRQSLNLIEAPEGMELWPLHAAEGTAPGQHPPGRHFSADSHRGVLFLVFRGKIRHYYRFTSFASHIFESTKREKGKKLETTDNKLNRSVKGNVAYRFRSERATKALINYTFLLWDPHLTGELCSSRRYNRYEVPESGTKDRIEIHYGASERRSTLVTYSWSGGCQVSPSYYRFRLDLLRLYQSDYAAPTGVFVNGNHAANKRTISTSGADPREHFKPTDTLADQSFIPIGVIQSLEVDSIVLHDPYQAVLPDGMELYNKSREDDSDIRLLLGGDKKRPMDGGSNDHASSTALYSRKDNSIGADYINKIVGKYVLIRPDEPTHQL